MGCLSGLSRVFLVLINILFLVIGLSLFAGGLFLRFGSKEIDKYLEVVKQMIQSSAQSSVSVNVDMSGFNVSGILFGVALGLIFFGLFLCIITVLGCCGSCYRIKCMLISYVVICGVLLVVQIIVIGILYGSPHTFHDPAKKQLKSSLHSDYDGLTGTDMVSMGWNVVMQKIGCCGVDSYDDFTGAPKWVVSTEYTHGFNMTPIACCKTLPSSSDTSCADYRATEAVNYLKTGCYDKIWGMSLGNVGIVGGVLGGIGAFQLLLILFGIFILCTYNENKTGHKD